jgi:hypothetical protein
MPEEKSRLATLKISATLAYTERASDLFEQKLLPLLLRAAGGKTFAAQDGSSARRLKGHVVGFTTLVTGYFKALALSAAACAPSASAEISSAAIAASLATLRLAQVSFSVIFLLTFREWKRRTAFGASDLYVWHV